MASHWFSKSTQNSEDRTETNSRTEENKDSNRIAVETETGDRRQEAETLEDWYKRALQACTPNAASG